MIFSLTFIPGASARAAGPIYISMISKGVQHQFWRGVMQGAMKASRDYNVVVTFEGPENESMVDEQIDLLSAALEKNPSALCIDALDSKAVMPRRTISPRLRWPPTSWLRSSAAPARLASSSMTTRAVPASTAVTGSSTR
jgi:ribose transport system substrate-binding protein